MKKSLACVPILALLLLLAGCATSTQLGGAAKGGNIREVEALLNTGANVNEYGLMGASPLYEAILFNAPYDIVRLLIDRGADVNRGLGNGWRPIHLAVRNGNADVVKLLLDRGADLSVTNPSKKTPLKMAEEKGATVIVRLIREAEEKKYANLVRGDGKPSAAPAAAIAEPPRVGSAPDKVAAASPPGELLKVAVWDLDAREVKANYARELTSILVSEVDKLQKYKVYSQENVRTLAGWTEERMKLGCTNNQCLTALGQMDVSKLISGSVGKIGNRYTVSLNVFDTQRAEAEKAVSEFCRSEDELIELVQTAVRRLLAASR